MARASRVVVLALVMLAMIGVACASADKNAPAPVVAGADEVDDDYSIGSITSGAASPNGVVAGPIGAPVPPGAFDNAKGDDPSGSSSSPSSSASFHRFSALAGASSAALAGFFFYF